MCVKVKKKKKCLKNTLVYRHSMFILKITSNSTNLYIFYNKRKKSLKCANLPWAMGPIMKIVRLLESALLGEFIKKYVIFALFHFKNMASDKKKI